MTSCIVTAKCGSYVYKFKGFRIYRIKVASSWQYQGSLCLDIKNCKCKLMWTEPIRHKTNETLFLRHVDIAEHTHAYNEFYSRSCLIGIIVLRPNLCGNLKQEFRISNKFQPLHAKSPWIKIRFFAIVAHCIWNSFRI